MAESAIAAKYVAFCDVLGFSTAVLTDFDSTVALYRQFQTDVKGWPFPQRAQVSVYSDSILVVSDDLPAVVDTVVALNWAALMQNWLIRGGIAHGKYWEDKDGGNLFVVSDALVKAVQLEKTVKVPAVVVSDEIALGIEAWVPRFQHGIFKAPFLHFEEKTLVNPFNELWFNSAVIRARNLLDTHTKHKEKYDWFLSLADAVRRDDLLVPQTAMTEMIKLGVLQRKQDAGDAQGKR